MKIGDITAPEHAVNGKPLDGIRILAIEQMQSLPYATQLLARMGAEVVKIEHPRAGRSGSRLDPRDSRSRWPTGGWHLPAEQPQQALGGDGLEEFHSHRPHPPDGH